ncbi:MAG: LPS assembly protein LptD [Phycisphaerales bacterium]
MLAVAAGGLVATWPALAQQQASTSARTPADAGARVSGRDFGGIRIGATEQTGPILFAASRAAVWTEEPPMGPEVGTTIGGPVQRLVLRGDVRATLGVYEFSAARAVVWIERLEPSPADPKVFLHQVAVYFDRVGDPTGAPGSGQSGDRLLVTGLVLGDVKLTADTLARGRPTGGTPAADAESAFLNEGERRLARLVEDLLAPEGAAAEPPSGPPPLTPGSGVIVPAPGTGPVLPGQSRPFEPNSLLGQEAARGRTQERQPRVELSPTRTDPLFTREGLVTFAAGEPTLVAGGEQGGENAILITGGVIVQYTDARRDRTLQISAERAVAFLEGGPIADLLRAPADKVRGIYLEGEVVATDGTYTLRGPQVYYDLQANRAIVVDAVFWTYDQRKSMPLYVRAKTLMQTAANQVRGEGVTLANSSFFTPHLSLGAKTLTVTRQQSADGGGAVSSTYVQGEDLTLRAGTLPFFYFPSFEGNLENFPLRDLRVENSSTSGAAIKTSFDVFGLLGITPPANTRADLLIDGYTKRGIGIGTVGTYALPDLRGDFLAYIVPDDKGTDQLTTGVEREKFGETRGAFVADGVLSLSDHWMLFLEGSYISDTNFIDAYYEPLAETRREFTNAADLRYRSGNQAFGVLAKGSLNEFTPNEYLLQSQGYTVDKMPEVSFISIADDLFAGWAPGLVSWSSEYRLSRMEFSLEDRTPFDVGLESNALAQSVFGLNAGDNIGRELLNDGYVDESVHRFDTRQELSSTFTLGPVTITPFVVARATAYDNDFQQFRAATDPANDDQLRLWYAGGVTASTSIQHVDNNVENRFFDLHRARHIFEPSITAWSAGTNIKQSLLPVYDEAVESLAEGSAARFSFANTFQTQRGGEGRWRTVDFLRIDPSLQFATSDTDRESPLKRFFDYRPEYSQLGDAFNLDVAWQTTDAAAITFSQIYDLDVHQAQRTSTGLVFDHSADFRSFVEMHYLHPRESTFVSFGGQYRLTRKYTVEVGATYDVDATDFQELSTRLTREFPSFVVAVKLRYNSLTDEVSLGFILSPQVRDTRRDQLRRLGRDQISDTPADGSGSGGADGGFFP